MKYCRNTTETHPLSLLHPQCLEDINQHIVDEGHAGVLPFFTNGEVLIDMDAAEALIAASQTRPANQSMDMTVGLKNHDSTINEMVLIEFKLRMVNPNNLTHVDLIGKVAGSTRILGHNVPIRNEYVFVFQSGLENQARSRISRINPKIPQSYIALSIDELKAKYF